MARRVTEGEKKEILKSFNEGKSINEISLNFKFTETTIIRQLKTLIKTDEYKNLILRCYLKMKSIKKLWKKRKLFLINLIFRNKKVPPFIY